jgi:hypothetical protein
MVPFHDFKWRALTVSKSLLATAFALCAIGVQAGTSKLH